VERIAIYYWTVYSMGLRLEEGLNLQVGDVDAARGLVHVLAIHKLHARVSPISHICQSSTLCICNETA